MGDELIDLELAVKVILDEARQLATTLDTSKSTSLPYTTRNELECCKAMWLANSCH